MLDIWLPKLSNIGVVSLAIGRVSDGSESWGICGCLVLDVKLGGGLRIGNVGGGGGGFCISV